LLNEFEEPVRAVLPQVTRTVNLAENLATRLSGPIDQVAPGLTRLAATLNSPVLTSLPTDLGRFVDAINDLVRRLAPLGQLAESATGLFGLRIPGMPQRPAAPAAATATAAPTPPLPAKSASVRKAPKKKAATKRSAAKKPSTKRKQAAKRSASRR
jgi:hypothetical protein